MSSNLDVAHAVAEEKKNVTVQIFGNEYPISGVKDARYVEELARYVDSKMKEIAKGSSLLSSAKVAILAALNMADELFREHAAREKLQRTVVRRVEEITNKIDGYVQK